ncbi:MAG TPA: hypothetical protein VGX03_04460 [Candidatus Binatia bacterium]|jgi:hypothetical protein|nr:hypothetical protein [Candidatus Binatia bacterium]
MTIVTTAIMIIITMARELEEVSPPMMTIGCQAGVIPHFMLPIGAFVGYTFSVLARSAHDCELASNARLGSGLLRPAGFKDEGAAQVIRGFMRQRAAQNLRKRSAKTGAIKKKGAKRRGGKGKEKGC